MPVWTLVPRRAFAHVEEPLRTQPIVYSMAIVAVIVDIPADTDHVAFFRATRLGGLDGADCVGSDVIDSGAYFRLARTRHWGNGGSCSR